MATKLETVSENALPPAASENEPAYEVDQTEGSRGAVGGDLDPAGVLVGGKSETPIKVPRARVELETVIGVDERNQIADTSAYPWRMIAGLSLVPRPPLTSRYIGTGWFIGPRTLLTAGHCVYSDSDFGGWIGRIEVSPGRKAETFPFGTVNAVRFSALKRWQTDQDPDYDVGCIHLDEPLGDTVGWFKTAALSDGELNSSMLNVSGYPGDKGGTTQWHHANRVLRTAARRIYYDIDTYGGQSGSPVWRQENDASEPIAVGIHAYGVGGTSPDLGITANSAPRLRPSVLAAIKGWLAEDGG